ncbi:hypothetical protein DNTS_035597 [Danionella cerebrum]|uniref:Gamma-soluble NSF attachment protein n=1 Tax=Danionella cerebrum TaxID=2873325 RepID=A0A553NL10_9TELE|nr:hypothetical protein DNTS_035597 [Danionella translucida]
MKVTRIADVSRGALQHPSPAPVDKQLDVDDEPSRRIGIIRVTLLHLPPRVSVSVSSSSSLEQRDMAAQKINEAHEHIAKAEKCLKTSMTKWKPDYDGAASEMAKAAVAFKNAKQFEQAKDAYLKEAEYHTENKATVQTIELYAHNLHAHVDEQNISPGAIAGAAHL